MIIATRLFAFLLICLVAAGPLRAQEELLEAPVLNGIYEGLEPKPAHEILTLLEFDEYTRLLADLKCYEALFIMLSRFAAVHSEWPSPLSDNRHVMNWYNDLGESYYPEVFFCLNVQQLREAQAQISQDGIVADRFVGSLIDSHLPDPVRQRNSLIFRLLEQAAEDYPLAYFELAHLSADGEIVRFSTVYQYYLLLRAKALGMQSDELDNLVLETRRRLTPDELAAFGSGDYWTEIRENGPIYE